MPLSIILINYRSGQLLKDCLCTIYKDNAASAFEIIIVDNSPQDGAKDKIMPLYPCIQWISMGYNAGFARANNAGIKASRGDAVLLLNPDTLIEDDAVGKCYESLMQSAYSACGVQLLNVDGSPQISGNFVIKGGLNFLMLVPYIGKVIRWIALASGVSKSNLPEATKAITEVDWINGAFLMVKKEAIEIAGPMDEDFFLYHEESEWCSRLKKAGKLCIFGDLNVIHIEGQTSNKAFVSDSSGYSNLSDRKGYQLILSMFVRIRKEFGRGWFLFHLLFFTISAPFILLIAVFHTLLTLSLQPVKFSGGFTRNLSWCWQYCLTILHNKAHFYKVLE